LSYSESATIDLHVHSTFSDGLLSPEQIVYLAQKRNLRALSITDHDEINGYQVAYMLGKAISLQVIPGIEVSTLFSTTDVHVLGYFINPFDPAIRKYVEDFKQRRVERAGEIVQRLGKIGIHIPFELVKMKAKNGSMGRPHIADVLIEEGIVFSFQEAFQKYLGDDKPAYVPKVKIELQDALQMIHGAGGLAFVAHPSVGVGDNLILQLIDLGLDGIETMHPKHTFDDIRHYQEVCRRFDLLESGGSDCHGARQGETMLGWGMVPFAFVQRMREKRELQKIEMSD